MNNRCWIPAFCYMWCWPFSLGGKKLFINLSVKSCRGWAGKPIYWDLWEIKHMLSGCYNAVQLTAVNMLRLWSYQESAGMGFQYVVASLQLWIVCLFVFPFIHCHMEWLHPAEDPGGLAGIPPFCLDVSLCFVRFCSVFCLCQCSF